MPQFTIRPIPGGTIEIVTDTETARLIADALDVIRPDDSTAATWASDCAFSLSNVLDVLIPAQAKAA